MSYAEQRREQQRFGENVANEFRDRVLAKLREMSAKMLEDAVPPMSSVAKKAYDAGRADAIKDLERWLSAQR
jgi:hypothetical protein